MPQPEGRDLYIDVFLSGLLIAYMNEKAAYIADSLFPVQEVDLQGSQIAGYTKEDWFRNVAKPRSPGTETEGGGFGTKRYNYFCNNFGTHIDIPDEDRKNQREPYDIDRDGTLLVGHRIMLRREIDWSNDFFKTGVWGAPGTDQDFNAGSTPTQWDDYGGSDPILDIFAGKDAIHSTTAMEPTDLTLGRLVWTELRNHPDFLDRIKYTQTAVVTMDLVARLLDVQNIRVGNGLYIDEDEGFEAPATPASQSAAGFKYIFGKDALLTYTARRVSRLMPTSGFTLVWSPLQVGGRRGNAGFPSNGYIRFLRDDKAIFDRIEGQTFFQQLVIGQDLGYFMENVID